MKKYLMSGEEVEAVQQLDDGKWLVFRLFEIQNGTDDVYEEVIEDFPIIVNDVFDTPPRKKIEQDIAEQQQHLEQIRQEIRALRNQQRAMEHEFRHAQQSHAERMAKYKRYDALKHLDQFLNDDITHYVIQTEYSETGEIVGIDDYRDRYDGKKRRLLALYGNTNGDLEWRLSYYSDGSGEHEFVHPFCSSQEAHDFLQSRYDKLPVDKANLQYVQAADRGGFTLPEGYRDAAITAARIAAQHNIQHKEEDLQQAKAAFQAL
jgi:hypothetical protein